MFCSTIVESGECYTPSQPPNGPWVYMNIQRAYSIIYYIIDGVGYYEIDGTKHQFKKGHLYIMPQNKTFSLYDDVNDKLYHAYIHAFIYPQITDIVEIDADNDPFLTDILSLLRKYINGETPQTPNLYTKKATELLISYVSEFSSENNFRLPNKIKQYIDNNFIDVFKYNNLSTVFNYSYPQILKIFKGTYNITPKQYCNDLILKYIVNQLYNGVSSTEIANSLNFSTPASFSRFFKKNFGCPPSAFLKKP
jgi:AraC-like DNA-binding protein